MTPLHFVKITDTTPTYEWWCTPLLRYQFSQPRTRCACGAALRWPDGKIPEMNYVALGAGVAYPTDEDDV